MQILRRSRPHYRATPATNEARVYVDRGMGTAEALLERSPSERGGIVSLVAWIILGLIAGFVASKIVNKTGEGFFLDIALGVIGSIIGGWLFGVFGKPGVSGLNLYSFFVAIVGAVTLLVVYHAIRRGLPRPGWSRR
jgi:uncharacterized membrane protein YeaQ/YmgE (transglycosylase-associated protein family)